MKALIAQSGALPGKAKDCAIRACIGHHGQNVFLKTRISAGVSFNGPERAGNETQPRRADRRTRLFLCRDEFPSSDSDQRKNIASRPRNIY
jgi:hypothetical protein